jgi:thymidine kinase
MSLHIVVGPMFAGKTTFLMRDYELDQTEGKLILDYETDMKAPGHYTMLYSHDMEEAPCFRTRNLNEVPTSRALYVNESQFFTGLKAFVLAKLKEGCNVHLYGLDGDFGQNKFGEALDLVPHCDSILKLTAQCACGKPALFSKRVSPGEEQFLPDAAYVPCCRACF